jgi:hypothetical protein
MGIHSADGALVVAGSQISSVYGGCTLPSEAFPLLCKQRSGALLLGRIFLKNKTLGREQLF